MLKSARLCGGLLVGAMLLSACATSGQADKAQTGAVIGTFAGAVIGAKVSSKKDRVAGAAIGAVLGGATGYLVGRQLDERDRAALQARIDELSRAPQSIDPVIWRSEHSGASAQIVVGDPMPAGEATKRVVTEADVELPKSVVAGEVGPRYASANVNVRAGPSTSYAVKYILPVGRRVELAGTSEDGFDLISENGVIVGYVSSRYLAMEPSEPKREPVQQSNAVAATQRNQRIGGTEPATRQSLPTREGDLRVSLRCKPVIIRVRTKDGQVTEEKTQTCMRADGTWGS